MYPSIRFHVKGKKDRKKLLDEISTINENFGYKELYSLLLKKRDSIIDCVESELYQLGLPKDQANDSAKSIFSELVSVLTSD
jgi:hypothetical protein